MHYIITNLTSKTGPNLWQMLNESHLSLFLSLPFSKVSTCIHRWLVQSLGHLTALLPANSYSNSVEALWSKHLSAKSLLDTQLRPKAHCPPSNSWLIAALCGFHQSIQASLGIPMRSMVLRVHADKVTQLQGSVCVHRTQQDAQTR